MKHTGIIVPLITPFKNNKIDYNSLEHLVKLLAREGISGLFTVSTTGEGPLLNRQEKQEITRRVLEIKGTIKVYAGTASASINETVDLAREYIDIGVDTVIVVEPYYYPLDQESLYYYFDEVLSNIDNEVILYTIPSHTGNPLQPTMLTRLAEEHSNLVGVKVTTSDIKRIQQFIQAAGEATRSIDVLVGSHDLLLQSLQLGAAGGILGIANIMPRPAIDLYNAYIDNQVSQALEKQGILLHASPSLYKGFTCVLKQVLSMKQIIISPETRLYCPYTATTMAERLLETHRQHII
ncbi:MAG: dihydrodipicolinate synthase family protein [Desulfurococcales archaeon]|nr:dihydrodipicolinate synthase family protein [Desulfurococcales archaeon]